MKQGKNVYHDIKAISLHKKPMSLGALALCIFCSTSVWAETDINDYNNSIITAMYDLANTTYAEYDPCSDDDYDSDATQENS